MVVSFEKGVRVIAAPAPTPGEITVMLYVCGGSAQETTDHTGASKVLAAVWGQESARLAEQGGSQLACFANPDFVYASSVWPKAKLEEALDFVTTWFIVVDGGNFEAARKTIISERTAATERWAKMSNVLLDAAYQQHPYRRPVFGPESAVENLSLEGFLNHAGKALAPSNLILVVVGDVDPARVQALAQVRLSEFKGGPKRLGLEAVEPRQTEERIARVSGHDRPMFLISFHKGPGASEDIETWGVIGNVLQKRITARLADRSAGIRRVSCMEGPAMRDPNLLIIYGSFKPEIDVEQARADTLAEVKRLAETGITETELRVAQEELAPAEPKPEAAIEIARDLADWLMMNGDWRHHFRYRANTRAVTVTKVNALARETFRLENTTNVIATME
ncbi:MAG: insulinase family protein [Nibricoccus sp.]